MSVPNDLISANEFLKRLRDRQFDFLAIKNIGEKADAGFYIQTIQAVLAETKIMSMVQTEQKKNVCNPAHKNRILSICQRLSDKLDVAAVQLECERPRTIINISNEEHTVLVWALHEFWDKVEKLDSTLPANGGNKDGKQQA